MYWFQKSNLLVLKLCRWGVIVAMGTIALVIPYEVFGRYVLGRMSIWSGELSTYSLVWATMMGAAVGLKKGYQVSMNYVIEKLPFGVARLAQGFGYAFMFFFLTAMIYFGIAQTVINHQQTSPGMEIPMSLPYAALPLGFFAMLLVSLEEFLLFLGVTDQVGNGSEKSSDHVSESM
jgi:TRAP-type C4-dicarboxylate transport system permease small subunit